MSGKWTEGSDVLLLVVDWVLLGLVVIWQLTSYCETGTWAVPWIESSM